MVGRPLSRRRKNGVADPLSETRSKTTPGGPFEQIFLRSYTGASRKALRRPHQCSADSTKPSPPKHGFSSCSASRGHPKDTERSPAETRILFVFRIQKAPPGSISQRQFYILGNHEAKVNDSSAFWGIRTQELTTVLRSGESRGKS